MQNKAFKGTTASSEWKCYRRLHKKLFPHSDEICSSNDICGPIAASFLWTPNGH